MADEDDVEKLARAVQVRKAPEHELRKIRPTGVALVPAGANARVFVVVKEDGEMQKLKLTPTAKAAAITAMKSTLDSLNATFAAVTGAEPDEAAEPSDELGVLLKQAGDQMHGMAEQFGKKKPKPKDDEVEKAGRMFSGHNEQTIRAAHKLLADLLAPLDAAAKDVGAPAAPAPAADASVAKSAEAIGVEVAKSVAEAIGAQLAPVVKSMTDAAANLGGALRAPEARVISAPNGGAPPAPTAPPARAYDPRDLGTVFDNAH